MYPARVVRNPSRHTLGAFGLDICAGRVTRVRDLRVYRAPVCAVRRIDCRGSTHDSVRCCAVFCITAATGVARDGTLAIYAPGGSNLYPTP